MTNDNVSLGGAQVEVYFDDFKVEYQKSPVVQSEDYYPFGLTFRTYSRENSLKDKFLYNDVSERSYDLNLNIAQTFFGDLDFLTGRWLQIDPNTDNLYEWSPDNYGVDSPIRYNDPKGDCPPDYPCGQSLEGQVTDVIAATVSDGIKGLGNIILAPFGKELSNNGNGITLTMRDRKAPETVAEAVLKPIEVF